MLHAVASDDTSSPPAAACALSIKYVNPLEPQKLAQAAVGGP